MNKLPVLALISLITITSCTTNPSNMTSISQTQTRGIAKIVLEEITRGSRRMAEFTPAVKNIEINGTASTGKMASADWKTLTSTASALELDKINTYQAPTTERFHDGALIALIKITATDGTVYESQSFDAGKPPKELAALYKILAADF